MFRNCIGMITAVYVWAAIARPACAQSAPEPSVHEHQGVATPGWMWMNDGTLFLALHHRGGDRSRTEFKSQNWLMAMGTHRLGAGLLTLKGMFSAEPLTETSRGYAQLFQMGEAYNHLENID